MAAPPRREAFGGRRKRWAKGLSKVWTFPGGSGARGARPFRLAAGANGPPRSHYVEVFKLLGGGLRDGGWMGEGRPAGGHALAILPGLTHYNIGVSPLFAAVILAFLGDNPSRA